VPLSGATIAFDLDGTLVETAPDLIGTLNLMLAEHGLPPVPLSAARHLVGGGARRMLEHGFREAGADFDAGQAPLLVERFVEVYRDRIADESFLFEGVEAALDRLAADGARLCVCTNKRTDLSIELLERLGVLGRFDAVVGPDAVSARKPDRAHLIEAVRKAGGDPARALMVGDSDNDVNAARAAGAPVIAVSFGYTETPPTDLGADRLIDRFDELHPAVRDLMS